MPLSRTEIDRFLAEPHTLVMGTLRADGRPHLSTVWYRWDGAAFWVSTNRDRQKYRNVVRDPRVTVLVDAPPRETSVMAYGLAEEVARDGGAYDGALSIVARYVDNPAAYLAERKDEPRVLLRIDLERVLSWTLER